MVCAVVVDVVVVIVCIYCICVDAAVGIGYIVLLWFIEWVVLLL